MTVFLIPLINKDNNHSPLISPDKKTEEKEENYGICLD